MPSDADSNSLFPKDPALDGSEPARGKPARGEPARGELVEPVEPVEPAEDVERLGPSGDTLVRALLEGTSSETGERFFRALVRSLCRELEVHGAWVTEYLKEERRLRALAFWLEDTFVDEYEYALEGTPCEPVIDRKKLVHVPERVVELYPRDPDLGPAGAVSYIGAPLLDTDGSVLGHLAVLDTLPMPKLPETTAVFKLFAERAAAELRRLQAEADVRRSDARRRRLVDGAMDAIVELDADLRVTHANPAAESVFKTHAGTMAGADFRKYLETGAAERLASLAGSLASGSAAEGSSAWIAGGLEGMRGDGLQFPAEATLARTSGRRGATYFTLILRDVNERVEAERQIAALASEASYLREELDARRGFGELLGRSRAMRVVLSSIGEVAPTNATVLITGETGTGKELIARAIHEGSKRRDRPMVTVNCAAIPETLMESEFFGHEAGAFTGATRRRQGRFALADGGTLFLDEIGELPPALQAKLLRVLQDGEYEPVGSSKTRKVDVRLITATNRNLKADAEEGRFREDLYYRLAVFPVEVPPLRRRSDDVVLLAEAFADRFAREMGRTVEPFNEACRQRLKAYDWPGNVRELQNVVERAVITAREGRIDLDRALPPAALAGAASEVAAKVSTGSALSRVLTAEEIRVLERQNLLHALNETDWQVAGDDGAARRLGMKPSTLSSKMKSLGLKRRQ